MKKTFKRVLSMLAAVTLLVTMLAVGAVAEEPAITLQAESGVLGGGATVKGGGRVVGNVDTNNRGSVTFTATVGSAGTYRLDVYYVTTEANSTVQVTVNNQYVGDFTNGTSVSSTWADNGGETVSATFNQELTLGTGDNKILIASTAQNSGWLELDYIVLTRTGDAEEPERIPDPIKLEAEQQVISKGNAKALGWTDAASGNYCVGDINGIGEGFQMTATVDAESAGKYTVKAVYSTGTPGAMHEVFVGTSESSLVSYGKIVYSENNGWFGSTHYYDWRTATMETQVTLREGTNIIRFLKTAETDQYAQVDYITLTYAGPADDNEELTYGPNGYDFTQGMPETGVTADDIIFTENGAMVDTGLPTPVEYPVSWNLQVEGPSYHAFGFDNDTTPNADITWLAMADENGDPLAHNIMRNWLFAEFGSSPYPGFTGTMFGAIPGEENALTFVIKDLENDIQAGFFEVYAERIVTLGEAKLELAPTGKDLNAGTNITTVPLTIKEQNSEGFRQAYYYLETDNNVKVPKGLHYARVTIPYEGLEDVSWYMNLYRFKLGSIEVPGETYIWPNMAPDYGTVSGLLNSDLTAASLNDTTRGVVSSGYMSVVSNGPYYQVIVPAGHNEEDPNSANHTHWTAVFNVPEAYQNEPFNLRFWVAVSNQAYNDSSKVKLEVSKDGQIWTEKELYGEFVPPEKSTYEGTICNSALYTIREVDDSLTGVKYIRFTHFLPGDQATNSACWVFPHIVDIDFSTEKPVVPPSVNYVYPTMWPGAADLKAMLNDDLTAAAVTDTVRAMQRGDCMGTLTNGYSQIIWQGVYSALGEAAADDTHMVGVFNVPEAYQNAPFNVRLWMLQASMAYNSAGKVKLEVSKDGQVWTEKALYGTTAKADETEFSDDAAPSAFYTIREVGDEMTGIKYLRFTHVITDPTTDGPYWYPTLFDIDFSTEVKTKYTGSMTLDAENLAGFRAQVTMDAEAPENALTFSYVNAYGTVLPLVVTRRPAETAGVYYYESNSVLPVGVRSIKVDMTDDITLKVAPAMAKIDLFYADPEADYAITAAATENGTVAVAETAKYNETVTVTVTPAEGYMLGALTVTTAGGKAIEVKDNAFVMPYEAVTVTATFVSAWMDVTEEEAADPTLGSFTTSVEDGKALAGDTVTVTLAPAEGYQSNGVVVTTADGTVTCVPDAENKDVFTFTMPGEAVSVKPVFGVRELDEEISDLLGASIRKDNYEVDGKQGLRFGAKFTDAGDDEIISVLGKDYTVTEFGFLLILEEKLEKFGNKEIALQNLRADGKYLKKVTANKLYSNTLEEDVRTMEYTVVITGIHDTYKYKEFIARPYYICKNDAGETVYFYGETNQKSVYRVKEQIADEGAELMHQIREASVMPNNDWATLMFKNIIPGSVTVTIPTDSNGDQILDMAGATITAVEGVDYEIDYDNGKIRRLSNLIPNFANCGSYNAPNGSIDVLSPSWFGSTAFNYTVYVTYDYLAHSENQSFQDKLEELNTGYLKISDDLKKKIAAGGTLTYLVVGDSISTGAEGTRDGYEHAFFNYLARYIESLNPGNLTVNMVNYAVGGAVSANGIGQLQSAMENDGIVPDLVSVGFGMNDQNGYNTADYNPAKYAANLRNIVDYISAKAPEAEIMLLTSMPPCPLWIGDSGHSAEYAEAAKAVALEKGVTVAQVHELFTYASSRKLWPELIYTVINHPGQYGHQLYATAMASLFE